MQIDRVDPEELDDAPSRRGKWFVVGGLLVAIAGTITWFVGRSSSSPTAAGQASTTTLDVPVTEVDVPNGVAVNGPAPDGFPDYGSDYMGPKLDKLYQRITDTGIHLTLHNSGDWNMGGGVDFATIAPAADVVIAPFPGPQPSVPGGWQPPGWCSPIGGFRLTMTYKDAIGVSNGSRYTEPRDGLSVTLFSSGYAEGTPFRALVLQLADDVSAVSVTWDDNSSDSAVPANGWAALATPGAPSGKFSITLTTAAGEHVVAWNELPRDGDLAWQKGCNPPPPELPAAGEQPKDPAAAEQQVRDTFDLLWNSDIPFEDKGDQVLDDTTGVKDAIDQVYAGGFADTAKTAVHTMTDLVFVSPDEAWFMYDIHSDISDFTNRFGVAYRIDGTWRIARAVICQDLSLAGGMCFPQVNGITPPGTATTMPGIPMPLD